MGTAEIFIVFSALMALIALVTIGIDWIGKPFKHRRFIARIYRFDDEKLPVDEYGHTTLDAPAPAVRSAPPAYVPPAPVVVAQVPGYMSPVASALHQAPETPAEQVPNPTAQMTPVPTSFSDPAPATTSEPSAFSSSLTNAPAEGVTAPRDTDEWRSIGLVPAGSELGEDAPEDAAEGATSWQPGVPLDVSVGGSKPSLAVKAERFWKGTAAALEPISHFDSIEIERMSAGKAPRRTNPRTGRVESMQLTGLRQASELDQVRMRWPEESVDPWNPS